MAGTDHRQEKTAAGPPAGAEPVIILVRPQLGENIGTAARAMLNCGLGALRLVAPRDGWPNPKALNAASGADEVIAGARLFATTAEAVADLNLVYATTARSREMVKPVVTPRRAIKGIRGAVAAGDRAGVLFGPERTGLDNEDVVLADAILQVPLNPAFASLNLAQAVLIVAYEWRVSGDETPPEELPLGRSEIATKGELLMFLERLEAELDARGFYPSQEIRPKMVRNMRNMFQRVQLTHQDVQTLFGIVKALIGGRARQPSPGAGGPDEDGV